jgi:hypothetical protein
MNHLKNTIFLVAALTAAQAAWAINKCTATDGKVVFQDAPCSTADKSREVVKTWNSSNSGQTERWRFERAKDSLTDKVSCIARSPVTSPRFKFLPVNAVLVITGTNEIIGLRTSDDSNTFHNDIGGMGMKTDNGKFNEITIKHGRHVVGVNDSASMIRDLEGSKSVVARVRFWPYEQLHDMSPISSDGFTEALKLARACASKL